MGVIVGIIFHFIGGFASRSFYMPYKKVMDWSGERSWFNSRLFSSSFINTGVCSHYYNTQPTRCKVSFTPILNPYFTFKNYHAIISRPIVLLLPDFTKNRKFKRTYLLKICTIIYGANERTMN
ncbi:hypothetical protein FW778_15985 [Ginsengibacter hankyongi]|uniref:Uncharacterized protein n=1 Tax=Ginsengibacter hankyongi TaxID=2607284 RepID=A0A5J5IE86_9BACT|nr:hypothetical protein FW778_15985 [Ginsengibacter hankyongi]